MKDKIGIHTVAMMDFFQSFDYAGVGHIAWATLAWLITGSLLLLGLAGTLIPSLPGHLFILFAAISHRIMLGADSGVEWWTFAALGILLILSQMLEFMSGAMGTRWFGGSKWGALGAFVGGIVGMFFMPFGLFLGPFLGTIILEFVLGKHHEPTEKNPAEGSEVFVDSELRIVNIQPELSVARPKNGIIQKSKSSTKSGVGTLFGVLTGMMIKIIIGVIMVFWFFIDVFWIG